MVEGKKARGKFILDDMSQCIATITTFAFIQQIRHPHELQIYPMLVISGHGVVMLLYNPNTDILLTSTALSRNFDFCFLAANSSSARKEIKVWNLVFAVLVVPVLRLCLN